MEAFDISRKSVEIPSHPLAMAHSRAANFHMPTNNNAVLVVINEPIVLLQDLLLTLAIARYTNTSRMNLDRRHVRVLVVCDRAELELCVEGLVAVRTVGVADTVGCARARLVRAA